jgi:hypothetical protein
MVCSQNDLRQMGGRILDAGKGGGPRRAQGEAGDGLPREINGLASDTSLSADIDELSDGLRRGAGCFGLDAG